jgi:hypothetical protein
MLQVEAPHADANRSANTIEGPMALKKKGKSSDVQSTVSFFGASQEAKRMENEKRHAGESLICFALEFALASRRK